MIRLSITIPSYNRVAELEATLRALLPLAIDPEIEIIVVDNCSDRILGDVMRERIGGACDRTRFLRNSANLGLAGNLLRCFEVASGDWIWLLGDDDPPLPDSVRKIREAIESAEAPDVLFKFNSTNGGEVEEPERIASLGDLALRCKDVRFYSNLLFISSSVFRRSPMLCRLNIGIHWAYSLGPHVAMLIDAMARGGSVRLIPCHIVSHGRQAREGLWNLIRLRSGFPSLCDMETGREFVVVAMPALALSYLGRQWWRRMIGQFLTDTTRPAEFWLVFYLRFGGVARGWRGFLMVQFAILLYFLSRFGLARKAAAAVKKTPSTVENLDRS